MRIIDLTQVKDVQMWPGRKLIYRQGSSQTMVSLPRGSVSIVRTGQRASITLGSLNKVTCQIVADHDLANDIMSTILESEKPKERWVLS